MNEKTLQNAGTLADLLEKQPLAGFLALTLLALVTVFGLLMWSHRSHQKTLREVVTLMTTFTSGWNRHIEVEERAVEQLERIEPEKKKALPSHQERS